MVASSQTIALSYNDTTPSVSASAITQMSITSDASGLKLSGDSASPGNTMLYGTNGSGVKGWYAQPSGSSGGANAVSVTLDFGSTFTDKAETTVTGESWVASDSNISAQVLTPSGTDPDEIRLLELRPVISQLVAGTGFTVSLYSEPEAKGQYTVMCLGV